MSWCNRGVEESQARTVVAMSLTSDAKRVEYPTPPLQAQPNADFCGRKCFLPSCGARCAIQQGAPFSLQRSFAFWLACEGMLSWPQIYNPRLSYPRLHQYTAMDDTPWPRVLIFFIRNWIGMFEEQTVSHPHIATCNVCTVIKSCWSASTATPLQFLGSLGVLRFGPFPFLLWQKMQTVGGSYWFPGWNWWPLIHFAASRPSKTSKQQGRGLLQWIPKSSTKYDVLIRKPMTFERQVVEGLIRVTSAFHAQLHGCEGSKAPVEPKKWICVYIYMYIYICI